MEFTLNTSPMFGGVQDRVDSWKISGCPIYDLKDNSNPLFESPFSTLGPLDPFTSSQQTSATTFQNKNLSPLFQEPASTSSNFSFSNSDVNESSIIKVACTANQTPLLASPLPVIRLPTVPWHVHVPPDLPSHVYTSISRYYPPTIKSPRKETSFCKKKLSAPKRSKETSLYAKYLKISEECDTSLKNNDKLHHAQLKKKRAKMTKNSYAQRVSNADHILKILLHFYLAGHTATSLGQKTQLLLKSHFHQFYNTSYFPKTDVLIPRPASHS